MAIVSSAIAIATACGGRLESADCGPEANYCASTDVCCPQGYVCGTGDNGCPRGGCCTSSSGVASNGRDGGADAELPGPGGQPSQPSPTGQQGTGSGGTGKKPM